MQQTVAIVIPIYKDSLSDTEILSLKQCVKILGSYPVVFTAPQHLDFSIYAAYCNNISYSILRFDDEYFADINGYNKLMLSAGFYKKLMQYKFILIYQLDAFVFKDELLYWCGKNYDFIGAPHPPHSNANGDMQFLKGYKSFLKVVKSVFNINHQISNVGNGGFSLRKTKTFYRLLRFLNSKISNWGNNNEDGFFKYWGNILYPLVKLPDDATALMFSVETSPRQSLQKLNYALPFGCHAFEKYDWQTWEPYIMPQQADDKSHSIFSN
jgi:hypothetical protein